MSPVFLAFQKWRPRLNQKETTLYCHWVFAPQEIPCLIVELDLLFFTENITTIHKDFCSQEAFVFIKKMSYFFEI